MASDLILETAFAPILTPFPFFFHFPLDDNVNITESYFLSLVMSHNGKTFKKVKL